MMNITSAARNTLSRSFIGIRSLHQKVPCTSGEGFQEILIPVPWGHIAGKWWGQTDTQPVIGLHGMEDNAGTFDNLAPLLRVNLLALDLPGHGRSSHFPAGRPYSFMDYVVTLRRVIKYFNWDKISIIGHSFGSCTGFVYSAVFPESVENYVSFDCARTLMSPGSKVVRRQLKYTTDKFMTLESKLNKGDPPCYEFDRTVDLLYVGAVKSPTRDSCKILLRRGLNRSGVSSEYYHFSRDVRLRCHVLERISNEFLLKMASRIKCNHLSIQGLQGLITGEMEDIYLKTLNLIKKSGYKFEFYRVEGTHHVHLNNAERVAPLLNAFLNV